MHQDGSRNVEDLADPQEFAARCGPVLAFNFRDIRGMDVGLGGDLLLREMSPAARSLHQGREITWMSWVLSHRRAYSSPRGLALDRMCLTVIFVTVPWPLRMRQA
jgi:hypothetical protein